MKSKFRRVILLILEYINLGDIKLKHHWVSNKKILLHSFKHKGYWWHAKNREQETIELICRLVSQGNLVIEVGGHIGYLSVILSDLIGNEGKLYVFEPGENNLPYIKQNLKGINNVSLVEKAITNKTGEIVFYMEDLTGQNNSIIKNYGVLEQNIRASGLNSTKVKEIVVKSTSLDRFVNDSDINSVDFIKIDIEGAELLALKGAERILKKYRPNMMVEITKDFETVYELLSSHGYLLYQPSGVEIKNYTQIQGNTFCLNSRNLVASLFT